MFFEINNLPDGTFSNSSYLIRDLWLNHDEGWTTNDIGVARIIFKGYVESQEIDIEFLNQIYQDPTPRYQGNFLAVIVKANGEIVITHDRHRGTPLSMKQYPFSITNLPGKDLDPVWADRYITITENNVIDCEQFDPYGDTAITIQQRPEIISRLDSVISSKVEQFVNHIQQPIKVFLSGGVDTLCLFSYLKKYTDNFELVNYEHIDFTSTYIKKKHLIDQYWGYKQIHLWKDPTILLTGANGDENLMRSPSTTTLLLMHYGHDIFELLGPENYHYEYLTAEKLHATYEDIRSNVDNQELVKDYQALCDQILNINLNDHQHWHFDNTLTWTPFKDLELCKIMLSMTEKDLLDQIMNAGISKELIEMNDPTLLEGLSNQKNRNTQENLQDIYSRYL